METETVFLRGFIFLVYDCIKLYKGFPGTGIRIPCQCKEDERIVVQIRVNWKDLLEKKWQPAGSILARYRGQEEPGATVFGAAKIWTQLIDWG